MAVAYVDTSSLVAIAFDEPGGQEKAEELEGFTRLVSSNLLEAEVRATFLRENVKGGEDLLSRFTWILPDQERHPGRLERRTWINRTEEYRIKNRGEKVKKEDVTSRHEIRLAQLPCWRHLGATRLSSELETLRRRSPASI